MSNTSPKYKGRGREKQFLKSVLKQHDCNYVKFKNKIKLEEKKKTAWLDFSPVLYSMRFCRAGIFSVLNIFRRCGKNETEGQTSEQPHCSLCVAWFLLFSRSFVFDSLWSQELQHTRPSCPHYLPEFTQTHVHWVGDTIQPSHPLLPPSPPALNLSQHQGLFQWVSSTVWKGLVLDPV